MFKKIKDNDLLYATFYVNVLDSDPLLNHRFFKVLRATTNTCEVVELQKKITRQLEDLQQVRPNPNVELNDVVLRCKIKNNAVIINDNLTAFLWSGLPLFQKSIILLA